MLGIACALYDEAFELIKLLSRQKNDSIFHYTGSLKGVPVSLFLTKPGLHKNQNQLVKWLKVNQITTLLQTGYCGSLTNRYRPGDVCLINQVLCAEMIHLSENKNMPKMIQKIFQVNVANNPDIHEQSLHSLITVERPVLTMDERDDINQKFTADLIDMEAWHICNLLKENFPEIQTTIIKIVGDVPGEEHLMKNEIYMRSFFKEHGIKNRIKIALKTGRPFFELYFRKRMLQKTLKMTVLEYIEHHFQ